MKIVFEVYLERVDHGSVTPVGKSYEYDTESEAFEAAEKHLEDYIRESCTRTASKVIANIDCNDVAHVFSREPVVVSEKL